MSNSFMSPLPTFTLDSLVTDGQWTAAQNNSRKKGESKTRVDKKSRRSPENAEKPAKSAT
ncbi:MAG TPA: hypothetical protein VER03_19230 [Bryobacteraceae bacterium]|nr:hypothetical protein [Bryobacteraceae bacterium]